MTREQITERIIKCAKYYVEHQSTVRVVGKQFGLSKSQVHINLTVHLKKIDKDLYYAVRKIMNKNKRERHLRGGLATKRKYYLLKTTD